MVSSSGDESLVGCDYVVYGCDDKEWANSYMDAA